MEFCLGCQLAKSKIRVLVKQRKPSGLEVACCSRDMSIAVCSDSARVAAAIVAVVVIMILVQVPTATSTTTTATT